VKQDPDFSSIYAAYYRDYDKLNYGTSLSGFFMSQSHKALEKHLNPLDHFAKVLEVGAGSSQHFKYVKHTYDEYHITDLNEEMLQHISRKMNANGGRKNVIVSKQDATALNYPDQSFDRFIGTHVLEHLPNPIKVLKEWNRVVRPGGYISIILPCDPAWLWRMGRHLGPRKSAKKAGMEEYDYFEAIEHINSIYSLVTFIRYYFPNRKESWHPFRLPVPDLNLFYLCTITA